MPTENEGPYDVLPDKGTITIGASKISADRVNGAPAVTYPILRDLADAVTRRIGLTPRSNATITIELDCKIGRKVGIITGRREIGVEALHIAPADQRRGISVPFKEILAFRVLKVEVEDLPAELAS